MSKDEGDEVMFYKNHDGVNQQSTKEIKSTSVSKKNMIIIGAIILIVFIGFWYLKNAPCTINLNDYLVITCEGYDEYGKANIELDWDAIEEKYAGKVSFKNKKLQESLMINERILPIDYLYDCIDVELSKTAYLFNGEKIVYTWNISEELLTCLNVKIKCESGEYVISGLKELEKIDAFSDLTVSFSGTVPKGKIKIEYDGTEFIKTDFLCDQESELSNGDVVTVFFDGLKIEEYAMRGYVPKELEKEYIVTGIKEYISEVSSIPEDTITELEAYACEVVELQSLRYSKNAKLVSATCIEKSFFNVENAIRYWGQRLHNCIYFIYKVDITLYGEPTSFYTYIRVNNIFEEEGECKVEPGMELFGRDPNNKVYLTGSVIYDIGNGFETLDELYSDIAEVTKYFVVENNAEN